MLIVQGGLALLLYVPSDLIMIIALSTAVSG